MLVIKSFDKRGHRCVKHLKCWSIDTMGRPLELGSVFCINHNLYVVTGITIENETDVSFEVEALDNESK